MVRVITLLCGDNDFELTKKVAQLRSGFDGRAERYDAGELSLENLADMFAGQTLFSLTRMVIIDNPSSYGELWQNLPTWAERLSDDTQLVLAEPKPDKRTSTYKWLKKNADVQEFNPLDERNLSAVAEWAGDYAKSKQVAMTRQQLRRLVERAGTDQWTLAHSIDKLALVDEISDQWIDDVVEAHPTESVFGLFETALNGDATRLHEMITTLRLSEDPYRLLGLLSSQALQLTVLTYGDGDVGKVASDTGAKSSYPYQKLAPYAKRLTRTQASATMRLFASADTRLKSSDADPWLVLESTLAQVASLTSGR